MSRPGILLVILIVAACITGRILTGVYESNTARPTDDADTAAEAQAPTEDTDETKTATPPTAAPTASTNPGSDRAALEGVLLNEAYQLSKGRALQYQDALEFQPSTPTNIQKTWQNQIASRFSSDSLSQLGLTLQTLGILPADEDLEARYRLRPHFSPDALYDYLEGNLLHTEGLDIADQATKEALSTELTLMLLDQNFHWYESLTPTEVNLDQALAERAFVWGDATLQTLKYAKVDLAASQVWQQTDSLTNNWPAALREVEKLPLQEGVHFCQAVSGQDVALDSIYQQLPNSTAHLIHPDRYLEVPRWQPKRLQWAQLDILRSEPVWENTIGELMIRAWLQRALAAEDSGLLASSWEGDGVLLYQTADQAPQLVWKSTWRHSDAAERFVKTLTEHAKALFELEEPVDSTPDGFSVDALLALQVTREADTVTIVRTTNASWTEALTGLASRSDFQ